MIHHRFSESPCPNCSAEIDSATGIDHDASPNSGDVTICLHCRSILIFGDDLRLRFPNDEEMVELAGEPTIVATMNRLGEMTMPSKSPSQKRLMAAAAHTKGGYGGVPQKVGKEFNRADQRASAKPKASSCDKRK